MEKQIFLRIAFGIVLKDLFTSKCYQARNLRPNWSSSTLVPVKHGIPRELFVQREQRGYKKENSRKANRSFSY